MDRSVLHCTLAWSRGRMVSSRVVKTYFRQFYFFPFFSPLFLFYFSFFNIQHPSSSKLTRNTLMNVYCIASLSPLLLDSLSFRTFIPTALFLFRFSFPLRCMHATVVYMTTCVPYMCFLVMVPRLFY